MDLRVLGSVELGDTPLSARLRRLLAVLVIHADTVVSTDRLVDCLWGTEVPENPEASLHTLVARLRRRLRGTKSAPVLLTRPPGYRLGVDREQVDATCFEDLVHAARSTSVDDPGRTAELLDRGLALWRGPAYAEFADDDFARAECARLNELRDGALEDRVETDLMLGQADEALARLEPLVTTSPLRERPRAQQMRALYAVGRQTEALAAYADYRRRLDEGLGLEPTEGLRNLQSAILRQDEILEPPAAPMGAPPAPVQQSPDPPELVGREEDVEAVTRLLSRGGAVTVLGPGGVGKTSLALVVASRASSSFADGALVCELAALSDPGAVAGAVITVLGLHPRPGAPSADRLVEYLAGKDLLLVLDNCEHLVGAVAELVDRVTRSCPHVAVLATSREPLDVGREQVSWLSPLDVSSAARLFEVRAMRTGRDPALLGSREAVAEICRRLDGLPLAIELAAARTRAMSTDDLADRLTWRFRLLRGGGPSRADRHRTLAAVVDWSYALLDERQRHVFELVGVFSGTFGLADAERVVAACPGHEALTREDVDDVVMGLVDRSMVVADTSDRSTRYVLLDTLRSYAQERLAEKSYAEAARQAHAEQCVSLAEDSLTTLYGPRHAEVVDDLEAHLDELRAAHRWSIEHDLPLDVRLVGALRLFVECRIPAEVIGWAEEILDAASDDPLPGIATVYAVAAAGARFAGSLGRAGELIALGREAGPDRPTTGHLDFLAGEVALFEGRLDDAERHGLDAGRSADALGPFAEVGRGVVALVAGYRGDLEAAVEGAEQIRLRADAEGSEVVVAWARYLQAEVLLDADPERADDLLTAALAVARRVGERYLTGVALVSAASLRLRRGDPYGALALFRDVVEHWERVGDRTHQWTTLRSVVKLLASLGRDEDAAVLLGGLEGRRGAPPAYGEDRRRLDVAREQLEERLGEERYQSLSARGADLPDGAVVAHARVALADPRAHGSKQ